MNANTYNGWKNKETRMIAIHIVNAYDIVITQNIRSKESMQHYIQKKVLTSGQEYMSFTDLIVSHFLTVVDFEGLWEKIKEDYPEIEFKD